MSSTRTEQKSHHHDSIYNQDTSNRIVSETLDSGNQNRSTVCYSSQEHQKYDLKESLELMEATVANVEYSSTATQIFGIFELLEQTLDLLSLQQVIRLQGVSHRWRDTIRGSSVLQRKLWMLARTNTMIDLHRGTLLSKEGEVDDDDLCRITINPFAAKLFKIDRFYFRTDPTAHTAFIGTPKGSWRNMLLIDPPCSAINRVCLFGPMLRLYGPRLIQIPSNPRGLTIGDVADAVSTSADQASDKYVKYGHSMQNKGSPEKTESEECMRDSRDGTKKHAHFS